MTRAKKTVPINFLREILRYDPETGQLYWNRRELSQCISAKACGIWNGRFAGKIAGSLGAKGYCVISIEQSLYGAHRIAWALHTGAWPEHDIDHTNGDRSDNRISNLRQVSHAENNRNAKTYKSNTSGLTGVAQIRNSKRWRARIRVNGNLLHLGYFDSAEAAAEARQAANKKFQFHENHGRAA